MNKMMMGAVGAVVGMTAFGDVVPTAYVSEAGRDIVAQSTHVTLDAAYRFDAWANGVKPDDATRTETYAQWGAYANWNADFIVTFDREVAANTVTLYGRTEAYGNSWVPMPLAVALPAGAEYGLLKDGLGATTTPYVGIAERVVRFMCGAKNLSRSNVGTAMSVELRLSDPNSTATLTLLKVSHTFRKAWFDAKIAEYATWPKDAEKALGGMWDPGTSSLAEVADVYDPGVLDINTQYPVVFRPTVPKTVAGDVGSVVISSELDFVRLQRENLPTILPSWKCGAMAVAEGDGTTCYYGMAKCGTTNGWVKLEGPAPVDGTVPLRMTLLRKNGQMVINYNINGTDYTYGTKTVKGKQPVPVKDIPVVASGAVTGIGFGGCGSVTALSAEASKLGSAVYVK